MEMVATFVREKKSKLVEMLIAGLVLFLLLAASAPNVYAPNGSSTTHKAPVSTER